MAQSCDLTAAEAVEILLLRHEVSDMVKQAFGPNLGQVVQGGRDLLGKLPSQGQVAQFAQNVMTPPEGHQGFLAANRGLMGAGLGALAGGASAAFGNRRKNWLRRALTGAMVGGTLGAATPLVQQGLQTAFDSPPTVEAAQGKQDQLRGHLNEFQVTGKLRPEYYTRKQELASPPQAPAASQPAGDLQTVAGQPATPATAPTPAKPPGAIDNGMEFVRRAARQSLHPADAIESLTQEVDQMNLGNAATTATGLGGRMAAQGAVGYGVGQGLNNLYRRATIGRHIPGMVQDGDIGKNLPKTVSQAVQNGARPGRAVGGHAPTAPEWKNLRRSALNKRPGGRGLGAILALLAAGEPIAEAVLNSQGGN